MSAPSEFASEAEKAIYVSGMFARIAPRYDLMNRLMTGGRDRAWRQSVAQLAALPVGGRALDVATGTGDIALALARRYPDARVVAVDFSLEMMQTGRPKFTAAGLAERIALAAGDALRLPFPDGSFDAATTGFALRNVDDWRFVGLHMKGLTTERGAKATAFCSPSLFLICSLWSMKSNSISKT